MRTKNKKSRARTSAVHIRHAWMANAGNRLLKELVLPIDAPADGSHRWTNAAGQPGEWRTKRIKETD